MTTGVDGVTYRILFIYMTLAFRHNFGVNSSAVGKQEKRCCFLE